MHKVTNKASKWLAVSKQLNQFFILSSCCRHKAGFFLFQVTDFFLDSVETFGLFSSLSMSTFISSCEKQCELFISHNDGFPRAYFVSLKKWIISGWFMDLSNFSASKRLKGYLVLERPDPAHVALRLCPKSVTDPFTKAPVFCWSLLCQGNLLKRLFQAFAVSQGRTDAWAETCCFIWWFCKWVARGDGGSHSEWQPLLRSPGWMWGSRTKIPQSSSLLGTIFSGSLKESLVKFLYTLFKKMNNENSNGTIQILISKLAKAFCVCLVAQLCLTAPHGL